MIFSSVIFLFYFMPVVLFCYFVVRKELRNFTLLIFSMLFYAWGEPRLILVLILSILINYFTGIGVYLLRGKVGSKIFLTASLAANLGLLFFYKYINFGIGVVNHIMQQFTVREAVPELSVALPVGISFFTFQGLSYVIDVYRGNVMAQRNPLNLALYIAMFPQLVAGPIVRYADICLEIKEREFILDDAVNGTRRFIIGLSKKVMIADVLAVVVDQVFSLPATQLTPEIAWLGAVCYTFQIYFDFSGYSDMAIGIGRIFGFHFLENFNLPYISTSITEFWRRWHISLSTWFRDYLYIPLGGNRRGNVYVNLFVVFLCTGLWHGAAFTFLFWGLWHGAFLIVERIGKLRGVVLPIPKGIRWIYTALIVLFGWVLFRSNSIAHAIAYIQAMFGGCSEGFRPLGLAYYLDNQVLITMVIALIISLGIPSRVVRYLKSRSSTVSKLLMYIQMLGLWLLFIGCMCMIVNGNYSPFIYFRF